STSSLLRPPRSTRLPYTTLFRSRSAARDPGRVARGRAGVACGGAGGRGGGTGRAEPVGGAQPHAAVGAGRAPAAAPGDRGGRPVAVRQLPFGDRRPVRGVRGRER